MVLVPCPPSQKQPSVQGGSHCLLPSDACQAMIARRWAATRSRKKVPVRCPGDRLPKQWSARQIPDVLAFTQLCNFKTKYRFTSGICGVVMSGKITCPQAVSKESHRARSKNKQTRLTLRFSFAAAPQTKRFRSRYVSFTQHRSSTPLHHCPLVGSTHTHWSEREW